jgi:hypothetical protein
VTALERSKTRRMNTTELIRPQQGPDADQPPSDLRHVATTGTDSSPYTDQRGINARPGASAGRDSIVLLEWLPIWPFMVLVALAFLAFTPLFALGALVALTGAIFAAPILLIRDLLRRG